ncbi:hypothetical protein LTR94_028170 [Friedmanniomyces endolithicus]|nr:hypothetical protein LTR94_028170 [Friedmanniomyces endolithicus]
MLNAIGYEVVEAKSAEQALELVKDGLSPTVVVTDHLMSGMSGAALGRELGPRTPVLIVSGYAENSEIEPHLAHRVERLADHISDLLPTSPSSTLLHGDLWGGNILIEKDHVSGLIDPACYYGDREVDLAMLSLFDQPPDAFYDACGLAQGWQERQPVYRLWPLLVHVRLFGGAYFQQAGACLDMLGY